MIKKQQSYFEHIYAEYFKVLYFFALRIVGDALSAEDIIQEVFLECWTNRNKIDTTVSIKPYLYKLTYNRCLDFLKSAQNKKHHLLDDISYLENLLFTSFSVEEQLSADEIKKAIDHCVNLFPERCKEVFILSRYHNLKNHEIAERLDISVKAVEKHISKALKSIRIHLLRAGYTLLGILICILVSICFS